MAPRAVQPRRPHRRSGGRVVAWGGFVTLTAMGFAACAGPGGTEPIRSLDARLPVAGSAPSPTPDPPLAPPARRSTSDQEGLGGLDMMPGLLDALVPSGCDFDNPMSSCQ